MPQLEFTWPADEETGSSRVSPDPDPSASVEQIAHDLRPRVLAHLRDAGGEVELRDLQSALGHPARYMDPDPLSNPVNRIVREMRDAGEIACREFEWGEPLLSLPNTDAADIKGNELAKRQLLVAAAGAHRISLHGPDDLVARFKQVTSSFGLQDCDDFQVMVTLVAPTQREQESALPGTSTADLRQSLDQMRSMHQRRSATSFASTLLQHAIDEQFLPATAREDVLAVANTIAALAGSDTIEPHHVTEAINYAPRATETAPAQENRSEPFSLQDFRTYRTLYESGNTTLVQHRREFLRLRATRDPFLTELKKRYNATQLQSLASRFGCFDARRNNKQQNAEHVYRALVQSFALGGSVRYDPMSETVEDVVARELTELTEETWTVHLKQKEAERWQHKKALSRPETLDEFRTFLREHGADDLTEQHRTCFEQLSADASRAARRSKVVDTVTQIESGGRGDLALSIKQGFHDKKQIPLWIVQLTTRVDRDLFLELKRKAKMLDGWYSSFKKANAGFQFTSEDRARRFASLLEGDADRSDILEDRQACKKTKAGERLASVAETLEREAAEILDADETRQKNTVRRAEMAAGMRGRAYANQAIASTLRSIAASLHSGDSQYLDGIRAATHITTLMGLLRRGKTARNTKLLGNRGELGLWERHTASEELSNRRIEMADASFVEYPFPSVYRRHLDDLVAQGCNRTGLKQRSRHMEGYLAGNGDDTFVDFVDRHDIEALTDYLDRCKAAGIQTRWIEHAMDDYKRLRAANIHTPQELRCALRELVPHLQAKRDDDPVRKAEEALIAKPIPGFYPTPKPVISRMLEVAEIEDAHRILEPSAGKGDILDMLREHHPDTVVSALELNETLHEVLGAKGHEVEHGDFLQHRGEYDRILMNPPFQDRQDVDHVRHAYAQLAPGGRLVSVMSQGPFFRSDRKCVSFREWLDELGGQQEALPEDAFSSSHAFRQAGVLTQLVWIDRPAS